LCFILTFFLFSINQRNAFSSTYYEIGKNRLFLNEDFINETPGQDDFTKTPSVADSTKKLIDKINDLAALVTLENRYIDKLDKMYQVHYPVGITKTVGGLNYTIILESDEITTNGAFLNAYMSFTIPQNGKKLAFAANGKSNIVKKTAAGGGSNYKSFADGTYTLEAEKPGFKKVIETVNVVNGELTVLEIIMEKAY
jgi:hypothetical protein